MHALQYHGVVPLLLNGTFCSQPEEEEEVDQMEKEKDEEEVGKEKVIRAWPRSL